MKTSKLFKSLLFVGGMVTATTSFAQLSSNPDKFLGNITTRGSVNGGGVEYVSLWNQITPENESKWESIEGNSRGSFYWNNCDNIYNYAKKNNIPFKFHTLIWGAQYPKWMDKLSTAEQYKAIVEWFDAVKKHYPDLPLIDVVNEAVQGHQPAPYKDALGGDGKTGYDWIIKAFELAHERWPDAILIYNDFNTFQWQKTEFINLVKTLRDAGAPIDAYGCQSHDLTDMNFTSFKSAMTEIQNALKMPMYSTEYDIGTTNDQQQLTQYRDQIKYMWESDYVAGITLWGYIYGATWTTDGNSGIIKQGKDRPAMTWLREYMASDAAKNAKGPFPGGKKEASVYVQPASLRIPVNEPTTINVRARLRTKTIEKVELYINNVLAETMTEAPYVVNYTPAKTGTYNLKAIVYDTEGGKYERLSSMLAHEPRKPYKSVIDLPGTIEAENFDVGAEGVTYHDSNSNREGDASSYRTNGGGVDIVRGNGGYAIGYTVTGEWMEYSVNVKETGLYSFEAVASAGSAGSVISIALADEGVKQIADPINVPCVTSGSWDTYKKVAGRLNVPLEAGEHIIRVTFTNAGCNLDKIVFKHIELNEGVKIAVKADPAPATINEATTVKVNVTSANAAIKNVRVYVNDVLYRTLTAEPYEFAYRPTATGTISIKAIAVDENDMESKVVNYNLVVNKKRTPYKGNIVIPGIIEAENFDKCGEGVSFHDSDSDDEGKAGYRTDNEGVDITKGSTGYVIGYTQANEWLEYTVDVKEPGKYSYEAVVSSGSDGSAFTIGLVNGSTVTSLAKVNVPNGGSWDTYRTVKGSLTRNLSEGVQVLRFTINGAYCNIDNVKLICTLNTGVEEVVDAEGTIYEVCTPSGVFVGKIHVEAVDNVAAKVRELVGKKGLYILKDTHTGRARKQMVE